MTVAKVTEITSSSKESFDDAVKNGIKRASKTLNSIKSAWVADHQVKVKDGDIVAYNVRMKVTFVLK
ncbi:MAG: Unknown protein [uncultured Thiotrichaceae bacterium]|uniref:Dodecin domain-containing protein n=1 Tax=uncultured Thiotrichaceae bacterium TaxID=298394 RepID=A0A6S6T4R1_9GAMM|nr:MAG: Unknown protein [uncultured Thiotrichaceae bacterium]